MLTVSIAAVRDEAALAAGASAMPCTLGPRRSAGDRSRSPDDDDDLRAVRDIQPLGHRIHV
jgi:hypothetical protein